jgi:hypothetical protein
VICWRRSTLFPARPLDLGDGLVEEIERPGEIAALGHALGQHRFHRGTALSTATGLPDGQTPLEQSHPLGDLALSDQCRSRAAGHHGLGQEGQAVFAGHSIALFDTLQLLVGFA